MNEKVVLTKAQADALEKAMVLNENNKEFIVQTHAEMKYDNDGKWIDECSRLNDMSLDELIRALYIGYEVEEALEEHLAKVYSINISGASAVNQAYAEGIKYAVNELGYKIKGINA